MTGKQGMMENNGRTGDITETEDDGDMVMEDKEELLKDALCGICEVPFCTPFPYLTLPPS